MSPKGSNTCLQSYVFHWDIAIAIFNLVLSGKVGTKHQQLHMAPLFNLAAFGFYNQEISIKPPSQTSRVWQCNLLYVISIQKLDFRKYDRYNVVVSIDEIGDFWGSSIFWKTFIKKNRFTHFMPLVSFLYLKNIRKPKVFQGV